MDAVISNKIYHPPYNYTKDIMGVFILLELLFVIFLSFIIVKYKNLHTRTNWVLFNWFLSIMFCLLVDIVTLFSYTPQFNIFYTSSDIILANIYFMFMLSFDCVFDKISERNFWVILTLNWLVVLLQCGFKCFEDTTEFLVIFCQIPLFLIFCKYLISIRDVYSKKHTVDSSKKVRFAAVGNYLLLYLCSLIVHSYYYNGLPNEKDFFQLFLFSVVIISPVFISLYLIIIDKNFRKRFVCLITCTKDDFYGIELDDVSDLDM